MSRLVAPHDQAAEGIVNGIFFNQRHVCRAGSRLLVQESVAEAVLAKLKLRLRSYKESGFGREGGRHGLPEYVDLK